MGLFAGIILVDADGIDPDLMPLRYVCEQTIQRFEYMFRDGEASRIRAMIPAEHSPRRDGVSPCIR